MEWSVCVCKVVAEDFCFHNGKHTGKEIATAFLLFLLILSSPKKARSISNTGHYLSKLVVDFFFVWFLGMGSVCKDWDGCCIKLFFGNSFVV
jgi:hypothetical protein